MKFFIFTLTGLALVVGGYFFLQYKFGSQFSLSPSPSSSLNPSSVQDSQSSPLQSPTVSLPDIISATLITKQGNIELDLFVKVAPKTVANFAKLAKDGFYNGTKFHRVIEDFVIQGGDPLSKSDDPNVGRGGPGYAFEDEINPKSIGVSDQLISQYEAQGYKYDLALESLPVDPGYIAMANSGPNTNGSQFFIVTAKPQLHLYGKHTVFGKVVKGMDVVLKIKQGDIIEKINVK